MGPILACPDMPRVGDLVTKEHNESHGKEHRTLDHRVWDNDEHAPVVFPLHA